MRQRQKANLNLVCQLRTSPPFDLSAAIIERDAQRDIATFRVSEAIARATEALILDCRSAWPPAKPDTNRALSVCGFPENMRRILPEGIIVSEAWGALAAVEDVTDREIVITYDPVRDLPTIWAPALPPLGFNLSGCSGGPVLMHGLVNGLHRWFPVGIIIRSPTGESTGSMTDFDIIRFQRIHVIRPDGTIEASASGWLPG
jgi:hypothetical protein